MPAQHSARPGASTAAKWSLALGLEPGLPVLGAQSSPFPQALVLEQAAQGSGAPDLRMQYLRQIQANHEVSRSTGRPLWRGALPMGCTPRGPPNQHPSQAPSLHRRC